MIALSERVFDPAVETASFREAMAQFSATVHVVTTVSRGRRFGLTVTAACAFASDPPSVLISVDRSSSIYASILRAGRVCLNVLGHNHVDIAARFTDGNGVIGEDRFDEGVWLTLPSGLPALSDAVASLDCCVSTTMSLGTHTVFGCLVQSIRLTDDATGRPRAFCSDGHSARHAALIGVTA